MTQAALVTPEVDRLHRRLDRERRARKEAEAIAEEKTRELYPANRQLAETVQALEQSNSELMQFASAAAHDLQTPLRSIHGFLQLLEADCADPLDPAALGWIHSAVGSTAQLQDIIHDLLEYARVNSRTRAFKPVPVSEVMEDVVQLLGPAIQEGHARVAWDPLPSVPGDRSQLTQLFLNLTANALRYHGQESPLIRIRAQETDGHWRFEVADNGNGIDARHHETIFGIFQRLHRGHEYPGTGVGLALCQRIVQAHRGRIWVEFEPGHGSRFFFEDGSFS